jgi:NTE family protein
MRSPHTWHPAKSASELLVDDARTLAALNRSNLSGLGPSLLLQLSRAGESQQYAPGEQLCEAGAPLTGFWVVLDGKLEVRTQKETVIATLGRSSTFGVGESLEEGTAPMALYAGEPDGAQVLFIHGQDVRHQLLQCGARRSTLDERLQVALCTGPQEIDAILLRSQESVNLPALTELLAATIVNDFEDRVVLVRQGPHRRLALHALGHPRLYQAWITDECLPFKPTDFDYIFIDEQAFSLLARNPALQLTTLQLTREQPPQPTWDRGQDTLVTVLLPLVRSPSSQRLEGVFSPEEMPLAQRGCWIQLPDEVLSGSQLNPGEMEEQTRQELSRWARAVTHRRIGLGLSGGGAWGFYHYVLLEELARRHIPVDIITGSSIGSVMGAYYSVLGTAGLHQFRERCESGQISLIVLMNILSTWPIEYLLEKDLGHSRLDQLRVRLHPVATDITSGKATAFIRGRVSLAVRASSSAPGFWGPTLLPPHHFVDGGTADNLPALWLPYFGADLTFSSNCYPAQRRPYRQRIPGRVGRVLKQLNPVGRWQDLFSSGSQLLHASGGLGARMSTCAYQMSPRELSLLRATEFLKPADFIRLAQEDEALLARVEELEAHWKALRGTRRQAQAPEARQASA